MITLIGGASRLGKSVLARQLMKKTGMPWLSSDALRSAFYEMAPKEKRDILFPCEGAEDNDEVFKKSIAATVRDQVIEAQSMRSGLYAFLQSHCNSEDPLILEGVHFLPGDVAVFAKKNISKKKNIRIIFLIDTDPKNILRGLHANTDPHDWLKGARPTTYEKVAEFIAAFSMHIKKEARKYRMPIYMRTNHFKNDMNLCTRMLAR
ncbi:hypothetical protein HY732_00095 [Candidatus Uhrbacteria bacterium]|nr:hypothetical protein [Candidatus Uhrbacteria bacterium]